MFSVMQNRHALPLSLLVVLPVLVLVAAGCGGEDTASHDVIARLGEAELTREELTDMMQSAPPGQDSLEAQQQIVEQWVTNELLHQEAQQRGLVDDPDVQRLLKENERTILINALISSFHEEDIEEPSESEIQSYYERHKEQLTLRSPYVRVRHVVTRSLEEAEEARTALLEASSPEAADSVWTGLVEEYGLEDSADLARHYYPENQVFSAQPQLRGALQELEEGNTTPVIETTNGEFHVLQLLDHVPAGSVPELEWVEEDIRNRLLIQARKQIVSRQVQRLRTEALSQNALETP